MKYIPIAVLYRIDNEILFEELKSMNKNTNSAATVLLKDGNKNILII